MTKGVLDFAAILIGSNIRDMKIMLCVAVPFPESFFFASHSICIATHFLSSFSCHENGTTMRGNSRVLRHYVRGIRLGCAISGPGSWWPGSNRLMKLPARESRVTGQHLPHEIGKKFCHKLVLLQFFTNRLLAEILTNFVQFITILNDLLPDRNYPCREKCTTFPGSRESRNTGLQSLDPLLKLLILNKPMTIK